MSFYLHFWLPPFCNVGQTNIYRECYCTLLYIYTCAYIYIPAYVCLHQDGSDFSDLENNKQKSIKFKFKQFQAILVIVQHVLGEVGDMEEGIRKLVFNTTLCVVVVCIICSGMYYM